MQVRCLPEEDCEEDGDLAALQVHLHLLWQGQDEEAGHWHLVVSVLMAINSQLCSNLFSPRCNDKNCRIQVAGGAYTYTTTAAASIRWKITSFNFFFLQQHSVFSPNVGESNFSCCYTS